VLPSQVILWITKEEGLQPTAVSSQPEGKRPQTADPRQAGVGPQAQRKTSPDVKPFASARSPFAPNPRPVPAKTPPGMLQSVVSVAKRPEPSADPYVSVRLPRNKIELLVRVCRGRNPHPGELTGLDRYFEEALRGEAVSDKQSAISPGEKDA
jgi:hypothetical protein